MATFRPAQLTDPATIALENGRYLRYTNGEWVETTGELDAVELPQLMEGEGLMFSTSDGCKWLFTPPKEIIRLPMVIYSGSHRIQ